MALKFVAPVKRQAIARRVKVKRSVIIKAKPKVVQQDYAAIDQFGEVPTRKREAAEIARRLGHDLLPWHQRSNDPAGRYNAYCASCNRLAVVCTETPEGFTDVYGKALKEDCAS